MPSYKKKKSDFFETAAGAELEETLKQMVTDSAYNTAPSYSSNGDLYPDNLIPFVNKHIDYIRNHPAIDPQQYLANLRLITRFR